MPLRPFLAAVTVVLGVGAALAESGNHPEAMLVEDAYARVSGGQGGAGAVYFMLHNNSGIDDRLIAARSDAAARTELHASVEDASGVMSMVEIADGIPVPAGEIVELARGGQHIMLMGLNAALADGDSVALTLTFAQAGDVALVVQVDNARKPADGAMDHGGMDHGGMDHGGMAHEPVKN